MKSLPRVKDIRVDWMKGWHNSPRLEVLMTRLAGSDEFRYRENGGCYFGYVGDEVRFHYHSGYPEQQEGYGGSHFNLRMMNGTMKVLKGPWSCRAGVMNVRFNPLCMDVSLTDEEQVWKDGYTFYGGSVTLASIRKWLRAHPEVDWELQEVMENGELYCIPKLKTVKNPCRACKGFKRYVPLFNGNGNEETCQYCGGTGNDKDRILFNHLRFKTEGDKTMAGEQAEILR